MSDSFAMPLAERGVLVTGASSGIGRAIACAMARAGADVAITYRANEAGAREVERKIHACGRRAAVVQLDLADEPRVRAVGEEVREKLGRLDVWVNNAGADILTGPGASLSVIERLDLLLTVDLRGTIIASWAAAELFGAQSPGGVIINMSWDHVTIGMPGTNPELFAAVKGGVQAFSKSLARSVAPHIRVNVLAPGWVETTFGSEITDSRREAIAQSIPMQRWGIPDDVAGAAVFLASPASSYVTGQTIHIGGGLVM
jgi:3-oxoacyl-[acyl-carrier protein] reductase